MSTTEYLPGMLTVCSPPGLLPRFSSWSLVCLGPSSLYSHNAGNAKFFYKVNMRESLLSVLTVDKTQRLSYATACRMYTVTQLHNLVFESYQQLSHLAKDPYIILVLPIAVR